MTGAPQAISQVVPSDLGVRYIVDCENNMEATIKLSCIALKGWRLFVV